MRTHTETVYLDLDGDGLPDAVRTIFTLELDDHSSERLESLEWGIGDDGEPRAQLFTAMATLSDAA